MTQNDSKGLREAQNDSIWLKMQCSTKRKNGSEKLKMTQNDLKWFRMTPNDSKWPKITQTGLNWL